MTEHQPELNPLKNIEGAIEAILFAAGYPVKYAKLAEVLGLDVHNVKTVIDHMAKEYNPDASHRGLLLLAFDDTCQLCTKEQYAECWRVGFGDTNVYSDSIVVR